MIGLVPADKLRPSDLIGVNKDSYLVLDTVPAGESARQVPRQTYDGRTSEERRADGSIGCRGDE